MAYGNYDDGRNPVSSVNGFSTEHAAAVIVIGALVFLVLIRRGFRGVGVPGVGRVGIG